MHLDREIAPSPELVSLMESGHAELAKKGQQQQVQRQQVTLLRPHPEQHRIRTTFKGEIDLLGKGGVPRNPKEVRAHEWEIPGLAYASFIRRKAPINPGKPEKKKR